MENEVPNYHSGKEGVYILASELLQIPGPAALINSRPYWIKENRDYAIWFHPEFNSWNIGAMPNAGTSTYGITSTGHSLSSIPCEAVNWEYQYGRQWIQTTTDVKVKGKSSNVFGL